MIFKYRVGLRRFVESDDGVATVATAITIVAIVAIFAVMVHFVAAVSARHKAQGAADLAALATAYALAVGDSAPCSVGGKIVAVNGARMVSCTVDGGDVVIRAAVPLLREGNFAPKLAGASARAGPTEVRR
ncbi:flp pilus-assembly TadE/G-like family protein [Hoyosella rhizosphaerae]|uniref:Putative Flp pilus-assembly TadG-like N-terminal domain-containing protein n=1 Tax=Hoyosella rhizosphaerae TaxID=1755582 RepID=A0A916XJY6_9ACTN|nr:Rv3654c family TadE-like protein [Hoyosella rhizosphaerae]MBN4925348.1 flp pilus-assembly TadE/G-like family protein [Hoyosella rhizosphaerae]GGC75993.1 hypothetical protein GCM10011410_31570 [Hoyosella rhizosphaerae]